MYCAPAIRADRSGSGRAAVYRDRMREFSEGPWREVRDGVLTCRMQPAAVNAGLVLGSNGVLLVDTGSSPAQGRRLAESAAVVAGRPVTHVLVTHWHFDHFFGLPGVEDAAPGVRSFGHETLMAHLRHEDVDPAVIERDLGFPASALHGPTDEVSIVRALDLGTWQGRPRRVEVLHPGPAHTDGDLVALVPDARVAFMGDLVEQSGDPAIGDDALASGWPGAIDTVLGSVGHDGGWLFLPGHGDPVDADFVGEQRIALAALWSRAEELLRRGTTLDEVVADANGAREIDWPFAAQTAVDALPHLWDEMRRQGIGQNRQLPITPLHRPAS